MKINKKLKLNLIRTAKKSKSRFITISILIMMGTTLLVGLSVSGDDIRSSVKKTHDEYNVADLVIYSDYGIQDEEMDALAKYPSIKEMEKIPREETVLDATGEAFRLNGVAKNISKCKVTEGRLPEDHTEIALDDKYNGQYKIGDTLEFSADSDVNNVLLYKKFKIVGFILSSINIHSIQKGIAYEGSGNLKGYGVLHNSAFNPEWCYEVHIVFDDLRGLNPLKDEYLNKINNHRNEIDSLLNEAATTRLEKMKEPYREKIDELENKLRIAGPSAMEQIKPQIDKIQEEMDGLSKPGYFNFLPEEAEGSEGIKTIRTMATFLDTLGLIFPWILYLVIALVTFANVKRFIVEERRTIGTLKGLGYSEKEIFKGYAVFGVLVGLPGIIIGMIFGFYLVPYLVYLVYSEQIKIIGIDTNFYPSIAILALALAMINTIIPITVATIFTLREKTVSLLKKQTPKPGTRVLFEKIKFIWSRLSFLSKVTARNLFRYKARMAMTIIGIASAVGFLFAGICLLYGIETIEQRQYSEIQKFDAVTMNSVLADEDHKEKIRDWIENNENLSSHIEANANRFTLFGGMLEMKQFINVIATDKNNEFQEYYNLMDSETKEPLNLENGAIISLKTADSFDLKKGDMFRFYDFEDNVKEVKIAGICEMYIGNYLFMNDKTYEEIFDKPYTSNANLVKLKESNSRNVENFAKGFMKNKGSETVLQWSAARALLRDVVGDLGKVVWMIILIATLLTMIVIYNLASINMIERERELSTLKVVGFRDIEVTKYLFKEIFILAEIGILVGFVLGIIFYYFVNNIVKVDIVMLYPGLNGWAFIIAPVVVLVSTFLMSIYFHFKFRKIYMLEALAVAE